MFNHRAKDVDLPDSVHLNTSRQYHLFGSYHGAIMKALSLLIKCFCLFLNFTWSCLKSTDHTPQPTSQWIANNNEQYSRRHTVRVTAFLEERNEIFLDKVKKFCVKLKLPLEATDIDRAHHVGYQD